MYGLYVSTLLHDVCGYIGHDCRDKNSNVYVINDVHCTSIIITNRKDGIRPYV